MCPRGQSNEGASKAIFSTVAAVAAAGTLSLEMLQLSSSIVIAAISFALLFGVPMGWSKSKKRALARSMALSVLVSAAFFVLLFVTLFFSGAVFVGTGYLSRSGLLGMGAVCLLLIGSAAFSYSNLAPRWYLSSAACLVALLLLILMSAR